MPGFDAETAGELWRLGVALAIGLVVGGEREQRKGEGPGRAAAGIRTFALAGLLGGVAWLLGPWVLASSALFVGGAALVSHTLGDRSDPGLTTEVALVVTFALGALAAAQFGPRAVPATAALAGFADAHASAASAASLQAAGLISEKVALIAIMAAFSTNALTKCALAFHIARRFGLEVGMGLLLGAAGTWCVLLLS